MDKLELFLKIFVVGVVLFGLGFTFSSEISGLFPNTSEYVPKAIHHDANQLGSEVVNNVNQKVGKSIETVEVKVEGSISNSIESSKKSVENTIKTNPLDSLGNFFNNLFDS